MFICNPHEARSIITVMTKYLLYLEKKNPYEENWKI